MSTKRRFYIAEKKGKNMKIDRIVLELMERIQVLEGKVARLEADTVGNSPSEKIHEPIASGDEKVLKEHRKVSLTQSARDYINEMKEKARANGETSIVLLCNDIQKALCVTNRPTCICTAMYDCMTNSKDRVLSAPPSGKSTTVQIEYFL